MARTTPPRLARRPFPEGMVQRPWRRLRTEAGDRRRDSGGPEPRSARLVRSGAPRPGGATPDQLCPGAARQGDAWPRKACLWTRQEALDIHRPITEAPGRPAAERGPGRVPRRGARGAAGRPGHGGLGQRRRHRRPPPAPERRLHPAGERPHRRLRHHRLEEPADFLEVLRAGYGDYVTNAEALAYMRQRSLEGPVIARLAEH